VSKYQVSVPNAGGWICIPLCPSSLFLADRPPLHAHVITYLPDFFVPPSNSLTPSRLRDTLPPNPLIQDFQWTDILNIVTLPANSETPALHGITTTGSDTSPGFPTSKNEVGKIPRSRPEQHPQWWAKLQVRSYPAK
jgi:hypothetical protein